MPTKNIECQLAQGQIGRYLNGERFSAQAIKQLEAHVAECDECSELVTRRRQALMTMLGEGTARAAVMTEARPTSTQSETAAERLISSLGKAQAKEPLAQETVLPRIEDTPAPSKVKLLGQAFNSKPLMYCAALAAVLLAMSYFSKDALKTFGPTADTSSILKNAPALVPVKPTTPPVNTSAPEVPAPVAKVAPKRVAKPHPVAPVKSVAKLHHKIRRKPRIVAHRATIRRSPRRLRASHPHRVHRVIRSDDDDDEPVRVRPKARIHRHTASPTKSTIRIYDPSGRTLSQ
jgi:hypothetical protein